jgi:hypothetical protein
MLRKVFFENRPVLVAEAMRIPPEQRDPNKEYYKMRHGDDPNVPCTIEYNCVVVNFWGTLVSDHVILNKRWNCIELNPYYRRQYMYGGEAFYDQEHIEVELRKPLGTKFEAKRGER